MPTVNQTNNKISRRLGELERRLKQQLETFYRKHIKGSNAPIEIIRQKYGEDIEEIIRQNVQTSWLFANDIVEDRTGENIQISVQDVQGIERVTTQMTNQFWVTSQKNLERETEFVIEDNVIHQLPEFALPAAMLGISALMLYTAFNQSMTSKPGLRLRFTVRSDCIDNIICLPLNGTIYEVGSQSIPNPPLHRHCHCKLIPVG